MHKARAHECQSIGHDAPPYLKSRPTGSGTLRNKLKTL